MCRTRAFSIFLVLFAGILLSQASMAAPLRIPSLNGIQVDGNPSDWGTSGFRIGLFVDNAGKSSASLCSKDTVRVAWDKRGLLVLFQISDATPQESPAENLWQGASVEVIIADRVGSKNSYHVLFSPGISSEHPKMRFFSYDYRKDSLRKDVPLTQVSARNVTKTGYVIEALLPWKNLDVKPQMGAQLGLQVMINHVDSESKLDTLMWYPKPGTDANTKLMYPVTLSRDAGHDKSFVAVVDREVIWPQKIAVFGEARLAGRRVSVTSNSQVVASGIMKQVYGRSMVSLSVPLLKSYSADPSVKVAVQGEGSATVALTDATRNTQRCLRESSLVFYPFVFFGTDFPPCEFENPSQVRSSVGNYTITRRFFNANYEEVTRAEKPGRYGALVTITTPNNGPSVNRFLTLFRQKDPLDWRNTRLSGTLELPAGMGIDATVCREQSKAINDLAQRALVESFSKSPYTAIVMAGLSETKVGAAPCTLRNDTESVDNLWWYNLRKRLNDDTVYHHSTFLPKDYAANSEKTWPLLIALHGSGDNWEHYDQEWLKDSNFSRVLEYTRDKYPMITVIPHCPEDQWWQGVLVNDLVDEVCRKYRVDRSRIYMTGYSMGGYGTFLAAAEYPDAFAAIAPICGGGDPDDAAWYRNVPVWAFHGDIDNVIPADRSREMVDAISKAGGDAKLTIYPGVDHSCWDMTFANPEFYEWLLSHSK